MDPGRRGEYFLNIYSDLTLIFAISRLGWKPNIPTYKCIPNDFPIKEPYPTPSAAPLPPSHVPYALRPRIVACSVDEELERASNAFLASMQSMNSLPSDYKDLKSLPAPPIKKEEPEQAPDNLAAVTQLRQPLTSLARPVKKEEQDQASSALPSTNNLPFKSSSNLADADDDEDYKPSPELETAFAGLSKTYDQEKMSNITKTSPAPSSINDLERSKLSTFHVKEEPRDDDSEVDDDDDYEPSPELLAACASLPQGQRHGIKEEPRDGAIDKLLSPPIRISD